MWKEYDTQRKDKVSGRSYIPISKLRCSPITPCPTSPTQTYPNSVLLPVSSWAFLHSPLAPEKNSPRQSCLESLLAPHGIRPFGRPQVVPEIHWDNNREGGILDLKGDNALEITVRREKTPRKVKGKQVKSSTRGMFTVHTSSIASELLFLCAINLRV